MFKKSLSNLLIVSFISPGFANTFGDEMSAQRIIRSEHHKSLNLKKDNILKRYSKVSNWNELHTYYSSMNAEDLTHLKMVLEEYTHTTFHLPKLEVAGNGWSLKIQGEKLIVDTKVKTLSFENRMMNYDKKSFREINDWMEGKKTASYFSLIDDAHAGAGAALLLLGLGALLVTVGLEYSPETCLQDYASMKGRIDQGLKDCSTQNGGTRLLDVVAKVNPNTYQAACLKTVDEEFQTFGYLEMESCVDQKSKQELCEKADKLSRCFNSKNESSKVNNEDRGINNKDKPSQSIKKPQGKTATQQ